MQVDPDSIIIASSGAKISHTGSGVLLVTITNEDDETDTIEVPPGTVVTWYPPAGWRSARFSAPGNAEQYRQIEQAAAAS